jgi:hypothetical protein
MPPLIEFNEKARPVLVKAFGGVLEVGHYYQVKSSPIIKVIPQSPVEIASIPDCKSWARGQFVTGPNATMKQWWFTNGLYQGQETNADHKWHVLKEVEKPEEEAGVVQVAIGACYITRAGSSTTPMVIRSIHNEQVGGPIFECKLKNPDGTVSGVRCWYNHKGVYLGGGGSLTYPQGNFDSPRTLMSVDVVSMAFKPVPMGI